MEIKLFHSESGDWEGLYIDGKLIAEDHNLDSQRLLRILEKYFGYKFENVWSKDEYLERYGNSCPETWEEVMRKESEEYDDLDG